MHILFAFTISVKIVQDAHHHDVQAGIDDDNMFCFMVSDQMSSRQIWSNASLPVSSNVLSTVKGLQRTACHAILTEEEQAWRK